MQQVALGNTAMNIVTNASNEYSRLLWWEVWNFMSITHGKAEFDERNIINIKGYNDSGKSAMLRALDVLMFNKAARSQSDFIQDDKEYFRIMAHFDDGVTILRDKYLNGQSLYEVYKDNACIFTTKLNGVLTPVGDVPEAIKDYLGVINVDGVVLNSRSCFEKQLLVQTTGSENYTVLNAVLKSEELAIASNMINTDKNKLLSDITTTEANLAANRSLVRGTQGVTQGLLDELRRHDELLDVCIGKDSLLSGIVEKSDALSKIPDIAKLPVIDCADLDLLHAIQSKRSELDALHIPPELGRIDSSRLDILSSIDKSMRALSAIPNLPEVRAVDAEQLAVLSSIHSAFASLAQCNQSIADADTRLANLKSEGDQLRESMTELGSRFVKCTNCNSIIEIGETHSHM